jgi:riboflavin synthase
MQVTLAETEQSDENEVAILIDDRMLNHILELVLSTTDSVGNEKPYEMMKEQPELDVRSAEAAA